MRKGLPSAWILERRAPLRRGGTGGRTMLLWEALTRLRSAGSDVAPKPEELLCPRRLPYDKRCARITKSGKRCRGRIRGGSEYCALHDPAVVEARSLRRVSTQSIARRRLSHLPDGYLRKLSNRPAIGEAMDRLYRELRLGIVSPEMGTILFSILTRLMDSGLVDSGAVASASRRRSRADRLRPKLTEILTRGERMAWKRAVASAPMGVVAAHEPRNTKGVAIRLGDAPRIEHSDTAVVRALQAAS